MPGLIKVGAKVVPHAKYVTFQMADVAVPCELFAAILGRIQRFGVPSISGAYGFGTRSGPRRLHTFPCTRRDDGLHQATPTVSLETPLSTPEQGSNKANFLIYWH